MRQRRDSDYVAVEVEADSYHAASTLGLQIAQKLPDGWEPKIWQPEKFHTVGTDLVHEAGCQCGWTTCPMKLQEKP